MKQITSRPSAFRTVELADFMSYLDSVLLQFEEYVFQHNAEPNSHHKKFVLERKSLIKDFILINHISFFEVDVVVVKPLSNVFLCNAPILDYHTRNDLLSFYSIGKDRLIEKVNEVINPNQRIEKHSRSKLRTFTKHASTARQIKNKEKNLSSILTNAFRLLQSGSNVVQTCRYPLAIADMVGNMRCSSKSSFRRTLMGNASLSPMFLNECLFNITSGPIALYLDFLYYIHIPPPVTVITYLDLAVNIWNTAVKSFINQFNVEEIYVVIDKPAFLPPPRDLVHKQRSKKASSVPLCTPTIIKDSEHISYGSEYTSLLTDEIYKSELIKYLSIKVLEFAVSADVPLFIIDSPAFPYLCMLRNGIVYERPSNEHGEADYAIWYHVMRSNTTNAIILSKDTDTWVYGLALMELGLVSDKNVLVKQGFSNEYVSINLGVRFITGLPGLSTIKYPVCCIVALYVLTGCDLLVLFSYY